MDAWRTSVCRGLAGASGHVDQAEVAWFAETYSRTYDELGESSSARRFAILEQPPATALLKTLPEHLRIRVTRLESTAIKDGRLITGRQVAWTILEWFKTDTYQSTYSTLIDLSNLCWRGDSAAQVEQYLVDWEFMVEYMPNALPDESLRVFLKS